MDDKLKTKGPVSEWTTVNKQTKTNTNIQSDKRAITTEQEKTKGPVSAWTAVKKQKKMNNKTIPQ